MPPKDPPFTSRPFCAALLLTAGCLNAPAAYFLSVETSRLYTLFTGPDVAAQQAAARDNFLANCTAFSQRSPSFVAGAAACNWQCTAVPAASSQYTCQWCAAPPPGSNLPAPWEQGACVGSLNSTDPAFSPQLVSDPSACTREACEGTCSNCQYLAGDPALVLLACALAATALFPLRGHDGSCQCCNAAAGAPDNFDPQPYRAYRPWNRNCCSQLPSVAAPTKCATGCGCVFGGAATCVFASLFIVLCAAAAAVYRGTLCGAGCRCCCCGRFCVGPAPGAELEADAQALLSAPLTTAVYVVHAAPPSAAGAEVAWGTPPQGKTLAAEV